MVQHIGHGPVSRAVATAAAAVRKHHESGSNARNGEISVEHFAGEIDLYRARCDAFS